MWKILNKLGILPIKTTSLCCSPGCCWYFVTSSYVRNSAPSACSACLPSFPLFSFSFRLNLKLLRSPAVQKTEDPWAWPLLARFSACSATSYCLQIWVIPTNSVYNHISAYMGACISAQIPGEGFARTPNTQLIIKSSLHNFSCQVLVLPKSGKAYSQR